MPPEEETTRVTHSRWILTPPPRRFPKLNWVHPLPRGLVPWRCGAPPPPRSYFRLNCILCLVEGGAFLTEARPDPTFVFRARVQPGACPTVSAHPAGPTRTATFWAPALWSRGRDQ